MSFAEPIIPVPPRFRRPYRAFRAGLYAAALATGIVFTLHVLFPILDTAYDFHAAGAGHDTIFDPQAPDGADLSHGKLPAGGALLASTSLIGDFASAHAVVTLENQSALPASFTLTLRRAYRSFFLPIGDPLTGFPRDSLSVVDGNYYALRDGVLYPFVSENAYLSRYPASFATTEPTDFLARYPVSETLLGFRTGSLVSSGGGIFVVTSETDLRPIADPQTFLALGYRFDRVIPASEEEVGIYKRGRLFTLGLLHPDGTLLRDRDTDTCFLVDHGTLRPILDPVYRDFLLNEQPAITASGTDAQRSVSCRLAPGFFGRSFACDLPIRDLSTGAGNDYRIELTGADTALDIRTLSLSFSTAVSGVTFHSYLSGLKQRILNRFGYGVTP